MPKARIYYSKTEYEQDHGPGALKRKAATGAGSQAGKQAQPPSKQQQLQQPLPQRGGGGGARVAPYSTRRQQLRQEQEEKEQLAPQGYEPVRGGKRKKGRAAMDVDVPAFPMYPPPALQGAGFRGAGGSSKASTALATAQAILNSAAPHPKKSEIHLLVQAHARGWVPPSKFQESLAELLV